VQFWRKIGPKALNGRGIPAPDFRFDIAQLRFCHEFDRSRTADGVRVTSRRCTNFRQPAVRIALLIANRSGAAAHHSQRLRSGPPCCGPIAALTLHLPFGSEAFWVSLALSDETR
jgi:hypothetical protein